MQNPEHGHSAFEGFEKSGTKRFSRAGGRVACRMVSPALQLFLACGRGVNDDLFQGFNLAAAKEQAQLMLTDPPATNCSSEAITGLCAPTARERTPLEPKWPM